MKEITKSLTKAGFKVTENNKETQIPESLKNRYNLPKEYLTFLSNFETIINNTETTWFNLIRDFNEAIEIRNFKWNEYELMSLEWVEDDEDLKEVTKFWNTHIPIIICVKDGYQFLAICLKNEKYGEIVHGVGPEFECATKICNSFQELLNKIGEQNSKNWGIQDIF